MSTRGNGPRNSSGGRPGQPQRPSGGQPKDGPNNQPDDQPQRPSDGRLNDPSDDGSKALMRALLGVLFGAMISCATFAWPWMKDALAFLPVAFTALCVWTAWKHRQHVLPELRELIKSFLR